MNYGKLENGSLIYAPGAVTKGDTYYCPYPKEMLIEDGWMEIVETPYPSDGKSYNGSWEVKDGKIVRVWTVVPEPEISAREKRERAYTERHIIEYQGSMITVDEANKLWYQYAAEGQEETMSALTKLIAEAKATIRSDYPDEN